MGSGHHAGRAATRRPRGPGLRSLPVCAACLLVAVELATLGALTAGALLAPRPDLTDLVPAVLLAFVAICHTEFSLNAERIRRRIAETRYVDMTSVWTLAAALLLPPIVASAVVAALYIHTWFRIARPAGHPPHRHLYSVATVVLAVHAVAAVRAGAAGPGGFSSTLDSALLVSAIAAYAAVNMGLVVAVIRLSQPGTRFLQILLGGEILLELSTLSLGGLVAVIVANTSPWLVLLAVLPLLVLEQTTLVRQLEARADTDAKTGLLNPEAWRWRARQQLDRARHTDRAMAVLMLDLDHFKGVNDRHGHLAGDDVLSAVAAVLTREIRDSDRAGRFGGEEFVVSIGGLPRGDAVLSRARDVAERIRRSVEALAVDSPTAGCLIGGLSVSIGVAVSPDHADGVDGLLAAADTALYEAKRGGRNQVRVHRPAPVPQPEPHPATPPLGLRFGT